MIELYQGDCIEIMRTLPANTVDLVLTDPPYGSTQCKWDTIIPFESMWGELNRICKPQAVIVIFGTEPFSSFLRISNIRQFKYDWIWKKDKATNHLNAKIQPMRQTEILSVFYSGGTKYNPQYITKKQKNIRPPTNNRKNSALYGKMNKESSRSVPIEIGYPINLLEFNSDALSKRAHPNQKPIPLLEYMIKTYTVESDKVLDFTMGSGSTGVACKNLNRDFIGIEKDEIYFKVATDRVFR